MADAAGRQPTAPDPRRAGAVARSLAGPPRPPRPPLRDRRRVIAGPLAAYTRLVLHYGDRGPGVLAVQRLLHVSATGWFGPLTLGAVRAFQHAHAVPVTGNVGALTWAQLAKLAATGR